MKKFITLILAAVMLLSVALPLTSCSVSSRLKHMDGNKRAVCFYELINEKKDASTSHSEERKHYLKTEIDDLAYEQTTKVTSTFVSKDGEDSVAEKTVNTVWAGGDRTVTYTDEGYMNGVMFVSNKEGEAESRLKSRISNEEYHAFRSSSKDTPTVFVGENYCTAMVCEQNKDGTWMAVYEGFTEAGLEPFLYMLRSVDHLVPAEYDSTDVRMTVNADATLYPTSVKIEFVFEESTASGSAVPTVTLETVYRGWNETELTEDYDLSDFTEVEDLPLVYKFMTALGERMTAERGTYSYSLHQTTVTDGVSSGREFVTDVTFATVEGAFSFEMISNGMDWDNRSFFTRSEYYDGTMYAETEKNGDVTEALMTDGEARSVLISNLSIPFYDAFDISRTEARDGAAGKYRLYFGEKMRNIYADTYADAGGELKVFESYVDIVMDGDVLIECTYFLHTGGQTKKAAEQDNRLTYAYSFVDGK
ncbi:MAG: hypothetical protein J6K29_00735 [Clostridia bacterium]|nr:hypothetical protein [Clostridia bacterium]